MMFYNGWGLSADMRRRVLDHIPATRPVVRCDHITRDLCREREGAPEPAVIEAYGLLDTEGYQMLAVTVDGVYTQPRFDRDYHVTVSHDEGVPSSHAGILLKAERHRIAWFKRSFLIETTPFIRAVGHKPCW